MAIVYILLKITALLAVMIIPFSGPKKKRTPSEVGLSAFAVNEDGFLEPYKDSTMNHHHA